VAIGGCASCVPSHKIYKLGCHQNGFPFWDHLSTSFLPDPHCQFPHGSRPVLLHSPVELPFRHLVSILPLVILSVFRVLPHKIRLSSKPRLQRHNFLFHLVIPNGASLGVAGFLDQGGGRFGVHATRRHEQSQKKKEGGSAKHGSLISGQRQRDDEEDLY